MECKSSDQGSAPRSSSSEATLAESSVPVLPLFALHALGLLNLLKIHGLKTPAN